MKRKDLLAHLCRHGCVIGREGGNHTIIKNLSSRKTSTLPRHNEINEELAKKICKDLGIARP